MRRIAAQEGARAFASRDDVDESHEREVAVDDGAGAADHFDAIDLFDGKRECGGRYAGVGPRERYGVDEDQDVAGVEREVEPARGHAVIREAVFDGEHAGHEAERFARGRDSLRFELVALEHGDDPRDVVAVHLRLRRDFCLLLHDSEEVLQFRVFVARLLRRIVRKRGESRQKDGDEDDGDALHSGAPLRWR